ncbi:MAG: hypothetical protein WCC00_00215 [Candidatus Aminicenantales bacterium]
MKDERVEIPATREAFKAKLEEMLKRDHATIKRLEASIRKVSKKGAGDRKMSAIDLRQLKREVEKSIAAYKKTLALIDKAGPTGIPSSRKTGKGTRMKYQGYSFEVDSYPIIPSVAGKYAYGAKVLELRSPEGAKLPSGLGELGEHWGETGAEASSAAAESARRWIDKQIADKKKM